MQIFWLRLFIHQNYSSIIIIFLRDVNVLKASYVLFLINEPESFVKIPFRVVTNTKDLNLHKSTTSVVKISQSLVFKLNLQIIVIVSVYEKTT